MGAQGYIGRSPGDSSNIIARQTYTPTGITTDFTFASTYSVGYIDVYLNGVRLVEGNDFTATDGSVVGLTTHAQNGDIIELVAYKAFNATNVTAANNDFSVSNNLNVSGVSTFTGAITATGGITGAVTGDATGLSGTPDITIRNLTGVAATFTGVLSYDDVTNVDSVGYATFRSGINVQGAGSTTTFLNVSGVTTMTGDANFGSVLNIDDSIVHSGDSNTKIRFPAADTFTVETGGSEAIRVDSSGRLGIGQNVPTALLHLKSNAPYITFEDDDNNQDWQIQATAWFAIRDQTNTAERLRIDSSGRIGIGTDIPGTKLHVEGSQNAVLHVESTDAFAGITMADTSGSVQMQTTSGYLRFLTGGDAGTLGSNATERLRIASNGSVGFNTTLTSGALTVNIAGDYKDATQNVADEGLIFQSFTTASTGDVYPGISWTGNPNALGRARASITAIATNDNAGSDLIFLTRNQADGTELDVNDDEKVRITSAGRVGIGTDNPARELVVHNDSADAHISIRSVDSQQAIILFGDNVSDSIGQIRYDNTNNSLAFRVNVDERLRIDSSGVVTIGVTAAGSNAKFEVKSTTGSITSATARINGGGTDTGAINTGASLLFAGHAGDVGRDFASIFAGKENGTSGNFSAYLALGTRTNGSTIAERLRITSAGGVGIGTTNPTGTVEEGPYAAVKGNTSTLAVSKVVALSNRNLVDNGAMLISQREVTLTYTNLAPYLLDRFQASNFINSATVTTTQESDAPDGFSKSLKMDFGTGATPASDNSAGVIYKIEGQDLQHLKYGDSDAQSMTVSFYVKSNKTGGASFEIIQPDNSNKLFSTSYTISSANTWEYKTITIPGDTSGVINGDNGVGLQLFWWLNGGSDFTGGSYQTTWGTIDNTNRNVSNLNVGAANDDYYQITGIQLELGTQATPFEHRSFGDYLERCMRYYETSYNWLGGEHPGLDGSVNGDANTAQLYMTTPDGLSFQPGVHFKVPKRANPIVDLYSTDGTFGTWRNWNTANETATAAHINFLGFLPQISSSTTNQFYAGQYTARADL